MNLIITINYAQLGLLQKQYLDFGEARVWLEKAIDSAEVTSGTSAIYQHLSLIYAGFASR